MTEPEVKAAREASERGRNIADVPRWRPARFGLGRWAVTLADEATAAAGDLCRYLGDDALPQIRQSHRGWAARALDLLLAVPLCVLGAPLILVVSVILAVQLRAWPLFRHDRVGHNGELFRMPKLRTLPASTPTYADKTRVTLEPPTRLARFLRRTHLDELPQLYLVPLGRLSLVGPRPRMTDEVEATDPSTDFARRRITVRQGCTGMWQIGAHQHGRVTDSPEYDLWYLDHMRLRLDVWILWRTVIQLLGAPPVSLDRVPKWAHEPHTSGG
jgi:lipopolysaccharide/colanic/teichoic acid biosynthesis glycosyltransferase